MSVELRIGDETVTVEKPKDYGRVVDKLTDTGEQLRLHRREPTQRELEGIVHAAEFLTRSAVSEERSATSHDTQRPIVDKIRVAMTTCALAGILHDSRIEDAYIQTRDAAFPVDEPNLTEVTREINEIQRRRFDIAKELTNSETSFADALDLAGRTVDKDIDVSKLVPEVELQAHEAPPTYDELLERVYTPETRLKAKVREVLDHVYGPERHHKPNARELYGYGLFNGQGLLVSDDEQGIIEIVKRTQATLKAKTEAKALAAQQANAPKADINHKEDVLV
jgi:hypothetical protein